MLNTTAYSVVAIGQKCVYERKTASHEGGKSIRMRAVPVRCRGRKSKGQNRGVVARTEMRSGILHA